MAGASNGNRLGLEVTLDKSFSTASSLPNGPFPSGPLTTNSIDAFGSRPATSRRAFSTSALTLSRSGVVSRPGAPPVPGGITNSGPFDASTTSFRGAIKLATSASPNCSSSPKTFRSTGCRQTIAPIAEETAHAHSLDPRVEGRGVEPNHPAFTITEHRDFQSAMPGVRLQGVDQAENLLHLVADEMPPQFKSRAIKELPVRQLGPPVAGRDRSVDQRGHDHVIITVYQPSRHLKLRRNALDQSHKLLGRLAGVGYHDDDARELVRALGYSSSPLPFTSPKAVQLTSLIVYPP